MPSRTPAGIPSGHTTTDFTATLDDVRADLLSQYNAKREDILGKVERLRALLDDIAAWWNAPSHADAAGNFRNFVDNIARNFGDDSACRERINSDSNWQRWRNDLAAALQRYPDDAQAWSTALARHA